MPLSRERESKGSCLSTQGAAQPVGNLEAWSSKKNDAHIFRHISLAVMGEQTEKKLPPMFKVLY